MLCRKFELISTKTKVILIPFITKISQKYPVLYGIFQKMAQKLTPHYLMHIDVLMLCSEMGIFLKMAITQKFNKNWG